MPMLNSVRKILKRLMPKTLLNKIRPLGHGLEGLFFHYYYGRPSDKLIIIAVTGTKGKTSTAHIIYQLLNGLDAKCGLISTAVIDDGKGEILNPYRMTQMSGAVTHSLLRHMIRAGYKYAVIEVSSEGLAQNRHLGINFDIAIFTNLSPDHVEAHGSFENYRRAKSVLFKTIGDSRLTTEKKEINSVLKKTIFSNLDDPDGLYYLNHKAEQYITYALENKSANLVATNIQMNQQNCRLQIADFKFEISLPGRFNIYNCLAAIGVAKVLGFNLAKIAEAARNIRAIPGRMEILQKEPFVVLVDYAHEQSSMSALYETIKIWPHKKIIQVLGATGGVRDKSRRTNLGKMAGEFTDIMIVTDEDPFDENPQNIIDAMANAAMATGKKETDKDLFKNTNRREAIAKALSLAEKGDVVLITGKGAEQKIARANGIYETWDDRDVTKKELDKLKNPEI